MTQGRTPGTPDLFNASRDYCDRTLPKNSIYRLLYEHGNEFFPDEFFADLFSRQGRHSVPPRIVATVMVLQRLDGLSDREAVDRFMFDTRWKYACGGLRPEYPAFVHTVLVYMRARLRASDAPTRIFDVVLNVARSAGTVGVRRVLDSTPLYDAVATQDTVTLIRSAIRGVLEVCGSAKARQVRAVLKRDDAYDTPGKPACDWRDAAAREHLIDALAQDGYSVVALFDGEKLADKVSDAVRLLATVLGQDLDEDDEGVFRIARRVARDRVISTVDPEARHGHKTASRSFDGYKGHIAVDPDSEIITATAVTAGNVGDGAVVKDLIQDILVGDSSEEQRPMESDKTLEVVEKDQSSKRVEGASLWGRFARLVAALGAMTGFRQKTSGELDDSDAPSNTSPVRAEVYGDAAYGGAAVLELLDQAGIAVFAKVQQPVSVGGRFSLASFDIDLVAQTVTCPAEITLPLKERADGSSYAGFGRNCRECPLREQCTTAKAGRSINLHPKFETLRRHREGQLAPQWMSDYRATRPKVERKLAHLVRRKHGGRYARVRGATRVGHDFDLLAAASNLARLAQLGLTRIGGQWAVAH
jgi:hypothetical protein